jgi:membrane-associated phospholipid phosphatase
VSLALLAYRQSGWFVTTGYENWNGVFEQWDKLLFSRGFGRIIESAGSTLPWVLEASYLFVYAVGPVGILILYFTKRRPAVDILLSCYLFGLLASYGQFAFWPSNPPRIAFPGDFGPMESWLREINLLIVGGFGIHTSVFPSAHVSGAVAAIFGVGRIFGWKSLWTHGFVAYAALVASATVYGRYHYAVDAAAGIAVGVVGGVLALRLLRWGYRLSPEVGATRDAACSSAA